MLDVGETIEPDAARMANRLPFDPAETQWSMSDLKRVYGSTFAYALDEMRDDVQSGTRCVQSFALGGLSNVWGAAVLPSSDRDLDDWPLTARALAPNYRAIAALMPIAAADDDLSRLFPLHGRAQPALNPSTQARLLLESLARGRPALTSAGTTFGASRLAVRSVATATATGCQYTGRCLTGCPHFAIWSSADVVRELRARAGFVYRGGFRVDALQAQRSSGSVRVSGVAGNGNQESFEAERVFVACGPIATARLLLHSLDLYDTPIVLRYQPYFLLPLLASASASEVESEALHTLAQVFVEIDNRAVSPHIVHLQFYTYNSFIGQRVRAVARWLGPFSPSARRWLTARLLAVQGYLHSRTSDGISLTARRGQGRARLELHAGPAPARAIRRVTRYLLRHRQLIGATPITPLMTIGRPGDGNHSGGTFPMGDRPGRLQTDVFGQLADLPRVHIVDSSVLPSLPATTLTYTVMANADRIARAAVA
jgi:choline dehydrogenase-like flavoprotein